MGTSSLAASKFIKHVVIIVQENRSFDNLFAGLAGADTQSFGYDSKGKKIREHVTNTYVFRIKAR